MRRIVIVCGLLVMGLATAGVVYAQVPNMNLSATLVYQASLRLSWLDWWNYETGFRVERIISGTTWGDAVTATLAANTTNYSATGLLGGTAYIFRVIPYSGTTDLSATGNYLTVTTASGATPTPAPTATATPLPQPGQIITMDLAAACTLLDPQFFSGDQVAWVPSGQVAWSFGRMRLEPGAYIMQAVSAVTGTHTYSASISAGASTTSTIRFTVAGEAETFTVTQRAPRTFGFATSVTWPANVSVENLSGGTVTLAYVCLYDSSSSSDVYMGIYSEQNPIKGKPLSLSDFVDYFVPIELTHVFDSPFSQASWIEFFGLAGSVFATFTHMTNPLVIRYYIGARVVLLAVAWFFGFVMKRIGLKGLPEGNEIVVAGYRTGYRTPVIPRLPRYRLPKL